MKCKCLIKLETSHMEFYLYHSRINTSLNQQIDTWNLEVKTRLVILAHEETPPNPSPMGQQEDSRLAMEVILGPCKYLTGETSKGVVKIETNL